MAHGYRPAALAAGILIVSIGSAQTVQPPLATVFDPGPRPTGTMPNVDCHASTKFTGNLIPPNCIDIAQPPSILPAPPAEGAGNILKGGGPLVGLWFQGLTVFETKASVTQQAGSNGGPSTILGLGPSFNGESCFQCHSQPTVGGSSAGQVTIAQPGHVQTFSSQIDPLTFQVTGFTQNPEITAALEAGATNTIPCFLTAAGCSGKSFFRGPIVETRFIHGVPSSGSTDAVASNGVAELFVIAGRGDTPAGCTITQVDTGTQFQNGNVAFRIPTPTFGVGLVENTPDLALINNASAAAAFAAANRFGPINGVFNHSGNDATISRFGWKAQNSSLLVFAGEAANVEMGVTNELFAREKTVGSGLGCISTNQYPEDQALVVNPTPTDGTNSSQSSVIENLAVFMRLNAPPAMCNWDSQTSTDGVAQCNKLDPDVVAGSNLFGTATGGISKSTAGIGCVLCHSANLKSAPSSTPGLSSVTYHPYSDFALHHMGRGDADFIVQAEAGGDQFRTAPLWGLGQRLFFMHDGRATNLLNAIADHCPAASNSPDSGGGFPASEACVVVANFRNLPVTQQQQLLKFLRSL